MFKFKVGDLVKTLINDVDGTEPEGIPAGEAGLIIEVCNFGERHNPIYSVRFSDNTESPYYQSDLEILSNV
tara:strand:- start:3 stop:215 length:213 start_codon:yes stop_codon:yes gene_type:complete